VGYNDDLQGLGILSGGAQGFIKGWQDADDRKMRQLELDAKLKSQETDRERQTALDRETFRKHDADERARKNTALIGLKQHGYKLPPGADPDSLDLSTLELDPKWINTQTQIAGAKSAAAENAKNPADTQYAAAGFATRMEQAERKLGDLLARGFDPTLAKVQAQEAMGGPLEGFKSGDVKVYEQAKNDFISAVLRKESGAAIGEQERAAEEAKYFPRVGDTPEVIANKAASRNQAFVNLKTQGGRAYDKIKAAGAPAPATKGLIKTGLVGAKRGLVAAPAAPPAPKGKVKVSDGKETLYIDAKDLSDAMKDGFKEVK
jgi:hypothetical protein